MTNQPSRTPLADARIVLSCFGTGQDTYAIHKWEGLVDDFGLDEATMLVYALRLFSDPGPKGHAAHAEMIEFLQFGAPESFERKR